MKKLIMTGNEAIARGAYEAGCLIAAAYPGTPSTEILENLPQYKEIYSKWSPNEKVAMEVACGAAIAGARALASMKHVGLNVASDPLYSIAYTGINGGLVVITADDPGLHSSQNEQDNRWVAPHAKVLMLEPSDSQECLDFIKAAFELSEEYDTPVLFRVTTRVCHSKSVIENLGERKEVGLKTYTKDPAKYVMAPGNALQRHPIVEEKLKKAKAYSEACPFNKIEWGNKKIGIITSGISYLHAQEVFGENASYLKLGMTYPLPDKMIKEFAAQVETVYVIEENDPYLEQHVKSLGIQCLGKESLPICGELNSGIIRSALLGQKASPGYQVEQQATKRPPVLCAGCPHRPLFLALKKLKNIVVTGDIGCYTLGMVPPLNILDTVICMGAGISAGIGFEKANQKGGRKEKVFGVIGDSTFFHSGITGLMDAVYSKSNMAVLILDNSITAMTGHQQNHGTGKTLMGEEAPVIDLVNIVKAVGVKPENIRVVDPYKLEETEKALQEAYDSQELFVVVTKRPCALIKEVQKERAGQYCYIDTEKCKNCKACLKTGCVAIAVKDDKMVIDEVQCNGCTVCQQVCKFDAIVKVGE
ncbi:indolepyruvate ferredoxin oxidoreductase, alpha subunit [Desulfosporosinus acidiphilus SJ4]|uniref:Indolepyruvate oxidoreductase subunit IorA n=1 Tax=Desulfosporosinus acidiphilus (strain DSM 22704 / JCM 16185 / SJ4) TaxID=646529 RepID=I4D3Z9_DESAJ|nr:indolepyruvate ferredoxin oxidoreductase subunit alpha [Desulfosporosinus acidiphilus]AFM40523.1 indolepyruvate ferredoxin oxidoreductase, alpha subunit [Desulfosporosinus acidiphilus SJ4]